MPLTYTDAVMSRDSDRWLNAMRSEIDSIYDNQVWTLVEASQGVNPIGCKWVYKKKFGQMAKSELTKPDNWLSVSDKNRVFIYLLPCSYMFGSCLQHTMIMKSGRWM